MWLIICWSKIYLKINKKTIKGSKRDTVYKKIILYAMQNDIYLPFSTNHFLHAGANVKMHIEFKTGISNEQ